VRIRENSQSPPQTTPPPSLRVLRRSNSRGDLDVPPAAALESSQSWPGSASAVQRRSARARCAVALAGSRRHGAKRAAAPAARLPPTPQRCKLPWTAPHRPAPPDPATGGRRRQPGAAWKSSSRRGAAAPIGAPAPRTARGHTHVKTARASPPRWWCRRSARPRRAARTPWSRSE